MQDNNVAYTIEYSEFRKRFDYIFCDKYKYDADTKQLTDNYHTIEITYYLDESHEIFDFNARTSKTELFDIEGNKVFEFTNIDNGVDFYSVVEHNNGKNYLFFSIDLYGYSILDLDNYSAFHYVPEKSFKEHEETFIWTEVHYCKVNNLIAVDGCYWAYPSSAEFYDFSNPDEFPLYRICSSYDLDSELNTFADIIPLRWNEDGTTVLTCCEDEDGEIVIQKTFDIISRLNS